MGGIMTFVIRVELGLVLGIFPVLVLFGVGFNWLTAWMERKGYMEGFTSLIVALGVALTLAPLAFFSWQFVLIAYGAFLCTGLPMIVGSIGRYLQKREQALQYLGAVSNGDESAGMAE
jgi:hypothetical protein